MKRLAHRKQATSKPRSTGGAKLESMLEQYARDLACASVISGIGLTRADIRFRLEAYAFELGESRKHARKQADAALAAVSSAAVAQFLPIVMACEGPHGN